MNIALDDFVQRNIACCMSSIIYDIGQHPDEAAKVFELNTEGIYDWFSVLDYEEAIGSAIDRLDLSEMIEECDEVGYSSDALDTTSMADDKAAMEALLKARIEKADDPEDAEYDYERICDMSIEEWATDEASAEQIMMYEAALRQYILQHAFYDDQRQEFCERHGVDLDYFTCEVYEHWAVDSWFGEKLAAKGECVFEFGGLTIWGRCTTGQAISMDHVIQTIFKETNCLELNDEAD